MASHYISGLVGAEGVVLKQQIQDMVDENETLKETVGRLNIELMRFQEKYGLEPNLDDAKGILSVVKRPHWLVSRKISSFVNCNGQLRSNFFISSFVYLSILTHALFASLLSD